MVRVQVKLKVTSRKIVNHGNIGQFRMSHVCQAAYWKSCIYIKFCTVEFGPAYQFVIW